MRIKSKTKARACALLLAGTLGMGCVATGCTADEVAKAADTLAPDPAPIVESIPSDAVESQTPAATAVTDHWSATIDKDGFTMVADVDVPAREESAYAVRKVGRQVLTQEMLDTFVSEVAPGVPFTVDDFTPTKAEIAEEIEKTKAAVEADLEAGDTEMAEYDRQYLDELTEQLATAPEQRESRPWDGKLYDENDGKGLGASLSATDANGTSQELSIGVGDTADPSSYQYLAYWRADFRTEQDDRVMLESATGTAEETDPAAQERLALYEQNPMSEEDAMARVAQLLSDMGIEGQQMTSASRALWTPTKAMVDEDAATGKDELEPSECTQQAMYVSFAAAADGLACISPYEPCAGTAGDSAPFAAMNGDALVAADGTILGFWLSETGTIGDTQGDPQAVLPLSQVQEQIADTLYAATMDTMGAAEMEYDPSEATTPQASAAEQNIAVSVTDARLGRSVIADPDDPNSALAIPAWIVQATATSSTSQGTMQIVVSALDGQTIRPPMTVLGK